MSKHQNHAWKDCMIDAIVALNENGGYPSSTHPPSMTSGIPLVLLTINHDTAKIGVKIDDEILILSNASKYSFLTEIIRKPNRKYIIYRGNSHHIPTSPNSQGLNNIPFIDRIIGGIIRIPRPALIFIADRVIRIMRPSGFAFT